MKAAIQGAFILVVTFYITGNEVAGIDDAFDPAIKTMGDIVQVIRNLRETINNLAKQVRTQQLFVEERIRSDGNSGIKQVRTDWHGTESYFTATHIGKAIAAIHDHSNYKMTIGMGETVVVLNGVEFRTRHNDYKLVRPSNSSKEWHAMMPIDVPGVPPEVSNAGGINEQILEMREWFKAFKEQNYTVRDYRKYFRPVLCYLEGAWTIVDEHLEEPFQSDRHFLDADTWEEAERQIRYTSASGSKDLKENFSFLPTTIIGFNDTTQKPIYGQWNYRILCYPYSGDIPLSSFRQQDDMSYREKFGKTLEKVQQTRGARYRLSSHGVEKFTDYDLIDQVMQEIPGLDNIPKLLNEAPIHLDIINRVSRKDKRLNTGKYHRIFKTSAVGAGGTKVVSRGFSDEFLYVAETTQQNVAPFDITICSSKRDCSTGSSRFSYAIPLEVVYLTPLLSWNPYDLPLWDNHKICVANGRNGDPHNIKKAYNGTSEINYFYLVPGDFFKSSNVSDDPADTVKGLVGVLDKNGKMRNTMASGIRIILPPIEGVGSIRLRYPIPPVHAEGSTTWKEIAVLKKRIESTTGAIAVKFYHMKLAPTRVDGEHDHEFYLTKEEYQALWDGEQVPITTSSGNGHTHSLNLRVNRKHNVIEYKSCDDQKTCWDKHSRWIKVISGPDIP